MLAGIFAKKINPGPDPPPPHTYMSGTQCQQTLSPVFTGEHMATVRRPVGKQHVCRLTMSTAWAKT